MCKLYRSIAIVLCSSLFGVAAFAAGPIATLSWSYPTTYIDSSPLPITDIATVTITWSKTVNGSIVGTKTVAAPATTAQVTGLVCGSDFFRLTVTTTESAQEPSSTSDPTNPAIYAVGVSCKPNPVTGVTVS